MEFKHLPEEMYKAVRALKELHNHPPEFALPFMLGIVNSAVAPYYNVESGKYGVRPTTLYLMAMADSGAGKGTMERELCNYGQWVWLDMEKERNSGATKEYKLQGAIHKKKYEIWEKAVVAGDIDPIIDPAPADPLPLRQYDYKLEKATLNGFIKRFTARPYLLLQGSEGGEFFNSHSFIAKSDNGGTEIMAALTKLWEGDTIDKNTDIESISLFNRRMCINIMLQKETVLDIMRNKVFQRQGILNRFLFVETEGWSKLEVKLDSIKTDDEIRDALLKPFRTRVLNMFKELPVQDGHKAIELQELPAIQSTKEAQAYMFDQLANRYNYNKHPEYNEHVLENYGGFRDRIHEHGIRIAATIACFNGNKTIQLKDAECAVELMDFFVEQREKFEMPGYSKNPEVLENVEKFWVWIKQNKDQPEKFKNKSMLSRYGPGWYRNLGGQDKLDVLAELCDSGRLVHDVETKQYVFGEEG